MFERFSSGYYLGRLYVEPGDGPHATISQRTYESVTDDLYEERRPLVLKLGSVHLAVRGERGLPARTLRVPPPELDAAGIDNPPTLSAVLLAKAGVASRLLSR
ncbi:hypothetical protein BRC71_00605 [Halobacteriales archaeon QH_7_65_31]|nr:MAG: hypothetical protein BRC71_00605 [Halobacteriales archaeon QH_7_65_31]